LSTTTNLEGDAPRRSSSIQPADQWCYAMLRLPRPTFSSSWIHPSLHRSIKEDCFTYRKVSGRKKRQGTSSIGGHTNLRTFRGISTSSERKNEARTSRVVFLFSLLYLASKGHSLPIAVISGRSGLDPDIRCSSWIVIEEEHTLARWDLHQEVARGLPTIPSKSTATTTTSTIITQILPLPPPQITR
jgi:hypothetical protein